MNRAFVLMTVMALITLAGGAAGQTTEVSVDPNGIGFPVSNRSPATAFFQSYFDGDWPNVLKYNSNCCVAPGQDTNINGYFSWGTGYWIQATAVMTDGFACETHQRYVLGNSGFCRPRLYYDAANARCYLQQDSSC